MLTHAAVEAEARRLGAFDVRFVRADAFARWQQESPAALCGVEHGVTTGEPHTLMEGAKSVAVLFFEAAPVPPTTDPYFARYYFISQAGKDVALALSEFINAQGGKAMRTTALPARAAALRSGGTMGDNGLYFHDALGSYLHLQTLLTDLPAQADGEVKDCHHCGACVRACPVDALTGGLKRAQCMRNHLYRTTLPTEDYPKVGQQLLGCEICQRACPRNQGIAPVEATQAQLDALDLSRLLEGDLAPTIELLGSNYARRRALGGQAALYIANHRLVAYGEALERVLVSKRFESPYVPWALAQLR